VVCLQHGSLPFCIYYLWEFNKSTRIPHPRNLYRPLFCVCMLFHHFFNRAKTSPYPRRPHSFSRIRPLTAALSVICVFPWSQHRQLLFCCGMEKYVQFWSSIPPSMQTWYWPHLVYKLFTLRSCQSSLGGLDNSSDNSHFLVYNRPCEFDVQSNFTNFELTGIKGCISYHLLFASHHHTKSLLCSRIKVSSTFAFKLFCCQASFFKRFTNGTSPKSGRITKINGIQPLKQVLS